MKLLSAQSVDNKQFKTVRLSQGYDMEEVDGFLDEVALTMHELYRQLSDKFPAHPPEAPTQLIPVVGNTKTAEKLLEVAQRAADEIEGEASHKAATIVAEATTNAADIERKAKQQSDTIVAGAYTRKDELESMLASLTQRRNEIVNALQNALAQAGESP